MKSYLKSVKFPTSGTSGNVGNVEKDENLKELDSTKRQSSVIFPIFPIFLYKRILGMLRKRLNIMKISLKRELDELICLFNRGGGRREMRFNGWPLLHISMALFAKKLVFKGDIASQCLWLSTFKTE